MEPIHSSFEIELESAAVRPAKIHASPADFDEKRTLITHLYKEKNWPLQKVMEFMGNETQFYATKKMYDGHFASWGIQKKLKKCQVVAALKAKQLRDADGKYSEVFVRGEKVDTTRIENYVRHRPDILRGIGVLSQCDHALLQDVCVRTPSPPLSAPSPLQHRETVLLAFNEWIMGSTAWRFANNGDEVEVSRETSDWLSDWQYAVSDVRNGEATRGARYLNSICHRAGNIIRVNNPNITNMLSRLAYLRSLGPEGSQLHEACVKHLYKLSCIILSARHPLIRVLGYLRAPISDPSHICAFELLQLATHCFESNFGFATTLTTDLYCDLIFVAVTLGGSNNIDILKSLKERILMAQTQSGADHPAVVFLKMKGAEVLCQVGKLLEARGLLIDAMNSICEGSWHKPWGLLARGILEVKLENDFAAEHLLQNAIWEAGRLGDEGIGLIHRCETELRGIMLRTDRRE